VSRRLFSVTFLGSGHLLYFWFPWRDGSLARSVPMAQNNRGFSMLAKF